MTADPVALPGSPDGVTTTPDGHAAFVAIQSGSPRIAVLAESATGQRLLGSILIPAYASGMRATLDGRWVLGAMGRGVVVLPAAGRSGTTAPARTLSAPASIAGVGPGAAEVAVSADSRYAFVTLEGAGRVAVFRLTALNGAAHSANAYLGAVPVGAGALGIAPSPDGRVLYEVSESALGSVGALNVLDVARAVTDPAAAVVASVRVSCAPVRVAVSPDGARVWVTARDGNAVLGYSAPRLLTDPAHALLSVTRVGARPLGIAVTPDGRRLLVADMGQRGDAEGVSVIDTAGATPSLIGTVRTGTLADAVAIDSRHRRALVTVPDANRVDLIRLDLKYR